MNERSLKENFVLMVSCPPVLGCVLCPPAQASSGEQIRKLKDCLFMVKVRKRKRILPGKR